ncbi:olfactory receptor 52K1-like [Engraulis encrasicolus]|uniref:olfactory receptor 52K1-like n=1 Tax=Engraulis encrasicolus TaxID=184585 RepID=UPI002FCF55C8
MGSMRYVLLAFVFLTYLATVLASVSVMLLVLLDTSLHKPMYIFLFGLVLNGLIGSTAVWPKVMRILSTNNPLISHKGCLIQAFVIICYGSNNFCLLAVMAYDRFVSIFRPLQYHTVMTPWKVKQLMLVAILIPTTLILVQIVMTSQLHSCKNNVARMYCDNLAVVALSCLNSNSIQRQAGNLYGIIVIIIIVALPICLVLLSYLRIIMLSFKWSQNARKKVFETCSPHIIIFVNFSLVSLFSLCYNRVSAILPESVNILMSINWILIPPLLHPIVYGIKTKEIRQRFSKAIRRLSL